MRLTYYVYSSASSLGISRKLDLAKRKAFPACSKGNATLRLKSGIAPAVHVLCIIHFKKKETESKEATQLFAANAERESFCRGVLCKSTFRLREFSTRKHGTLHTLRMLCWWRCEKKTTVAQYPFKCKFFIDLGMFVLGKLASRDKEKFIFPIKLLCRVCSDCL